MRLSYLIVTTASFLLTACSGIPLIWFSENARRDFMEKSAGYLKIESCVEDDRIDELPNTLPVEVVECIITGNILRPFEIKGIEVRHWDTFFFIKNNGNIVEYDRERKMVSIRETRTFPGGFCAGNECFKVEIDSNRWIGVSSNIGKYIITRGDTTFYRLY